MNYRLVICLLELVSDSQAEMCGYKSMLLDVVSQKKSLSGSLVVRNSQLVACWDFSSTLLSLHGGCIYNAANINDSIEKNQMKCSR